MKKSPLLHLFVCAATAIAIGSASAQTLSITNTSTNTAFATGVYSTILLDQFDTALGTLSGVAVTVNYSTVSGSFNITTTTSQVFNITNSVAVNIRQSATNSLGFAQLGPTSFGLATTPPVTIIVPAATSTNISVNTTNVYLNEAQSISNVDWGAYQSASPGKVAFEFNTVPTIGVAGSGFTVTATNNLTVETSMSVVYTYDVIPEPSTYALLGVAALGFAGYRLRRRRA